MPSPRFEKGHAKLGGRKKGTPNKPITVKMAMKTFTSERGAELMAFAEEVMNLPNWVEVGEKGHICLLPYKMQVWVEMNRYGIGKHANQSADTGRGDMNVTRSTPLARTRRPWIA